MPSQQLDVRKLRRRPGSRSHVLVMGGETQVRAGTADWVEHELTGGAKVLYKGWIRTDRSPAEHWIVADGTAPHARAALASGQLVLLDYPSVIDRCGGTTEGLWRLQQEEVRDAVGEGWPSVALTQETAHRPIADRAEAAEFAAQERHYDLLSTRWPINTLCQLQLGDEGDAAMRESVAVHHHDVVASGWSARAAGGRWHLGGDLDVTVERELAAAVGARLRGAGARSRVDEVRIDLGDVTFMDVACAQALLAAAGALPAGRRVVLHRTPPVVRGLFGLIGVPDSVVDAGDGTR